MQQAGTHSFQIHKNAVYSYKPLIRPTSYVNFVPFRVASNWSALWSRDHVITNKLRGIHRILQTFGAWNPKDELLFCLETKI